jgi:hypothetical protein
VLLLRSFVYQAYLFAAPTAKEKNSVAPGTIEQFSSTVTKCNCAMGPGVGLPLLRVSALVVLLGLVCFCFSADFST